MADKDVVAEIERRRSAWPSLLVAENGLHAPTVAVGLDALVVELREVAELYSRAKMRGAKREIDELNAAARVIESLAAGTRRRDEPAATPSRGGPGVPAEWCGDGEDHGPHSWAKRDRDEHNELVMRDRECLGRHATSTAGLAALIAERSGAVREALDRTWPVEVPDAVPRSDLETYLRGGPEVPGSPPLGPGGVKPAAPDEIERALSTGRAAGILSPGAEAELRASFDGFDEPAPVGWSNDTTSADGFRLPGVSGFDEPAVRGRDLGRKVSWVDLQQLIGKDRRGAGLPLHLSNSQMNTLDECGLKYVMQRDEELGVVEIPQWSLIGGSAFHAAVEWFERVAAEVRLLQHVRDRLTVFRDEHGGRGQTIGEALWAWAFGKEITEVALASPVPQDDWRAANKGMENYTWWLINGGDMVQRYLDHRLAELTGGWRSIRAGWLPGGPSGTEGEPAPMVEWETRTLVDGTEVIGFIDQVWDVTQDHGVMKAGDLLIDDCKSSAKVGMGGDTRQLGEYALWLAENGPGAGGRRIWGRYYDARKGTWTEPVDLLARHPRVELEVRVQGAEIRKANGLFTPHRTNFCGGCSVKHACPIFATAGA